MSLKTTASGWYLLSSGPYLILLDSARSTARPKIWDSSGEEVELGSTELSEVIDSADEMSPVSHSDVVLLESQPHLLKALSKGLLDLITDQFKSSRKAKKAAQDYMKRAGTEVQRLDKLVKKNEDLAEAIEMSLKKGTIDSIDDIEKLAKMLDSDEEMSKLLKVEEEKEEEPEATPVQVSLRDAGRIIGADVTHLANLPSDEVAKELDRELRKNRKVYDLTTDLSVSGPTLRESKDPNKPTPTPKPKSKTTQKNLDNRTVDFLFENFDNQYAFIQKFGLEKHPGANTFLYHF